MPNYHRIFAFNSYVFITVITCNRDALLIKNIEILRHAFANSKKFYNYELYGIVILPDHVHMLIKPENIKDYPKIISRIKHYFSRNIKYANVELSESKIQKREKGIWQRRYWEHTIIDETDLYTHLDYIHYNPVKHRHVNAVKDWEYSSFNKFVKQGNYEEYWGNYNDVKNIIDIELE